MAVRTRPFWIHQLAEYLLGVAVLSQGLQSARPVAPMLLGVAMIVGEGTARGPLAALPKLDRPTHRWVDAVLLAVLVGLVAVGEPLVSDPMRVTLIGVGALHGFLLWRTDYRTPAPRVRRKRVRQPAPTPTPTATPTPSPTPSPSPTVGGRSEDIGRRAGRTAGALYNAARQRKRP